jgi:DnaJ-class molecular chaperone
LDSTEINHYAVLGLTRDCTIDQMRAAYRLLAKHLHPDRNESPEAPDRMRELVEAHDVLTDPDRRRAYDRELDEKEKRNRPARAGRLEHDITQDAQLQIEDFFRGITLDIRVDDPANSRGDETYSLTVEPETPPGTRLRVERTDNPDGGAVIVKLKPLPGYRFKAKGSDLRCDLNISPERAETGGIEIIQDAEGDSVEVEIPPHVGRGEILILPDGGLPNTNGGRGDLLVRIQYKPRVSVKRAQREI